MAKRPQHQARSSLFNVNHNNNNNNNNNNSNHNHNSNNNKNTIVHIPNSNNNSTNNNNQLFLEQQNDAAEKSFNDYTSLLRKNVQSLKDVVHYMNDEVLSDHTLIDQTNTSADSNRYSLKNSYKKLQEDVIQVKTCRQVLMLSFIIVMVFFIVFYGGKFFVFQVLLSKSGNHHINSSSSSNNGGSSSNSIGNQVNTNSVAKLVTK